MVEIVWQRRAFDRMGELIRTNPDRVAEIQPALQRLNRVLLSDPTGAGESRHRPYRVVTVKPLTLYFRTNRDGSVVYIIAVILHARRA